MRKFDLVKCPTSAERLLATLAFLILGFVVVRRLTATPAVEWLLVYRITDFKTWTDFWTFMKQSRSGISPILAALEIPAQLLLGSPEIVTKYMYRAGFVCTFVVPWLVFSRTRIQFWISFVTCLVFLCAASKIAPANPQAYDVYFPLSLLLSLWCLHTASRARTLRAAIGFAATAGLCIAAAELLRPFGIAFALLLIAYAVILFVPRRGAAILAVLVPVIALSGTWHLKLLVLNGGQILWSNHGGTNLYNGWQTILPEDLKPVPIDPLEKLAMSPQTFVGSGDYSWLRPDSAYHTNESRRLGSIVSCYIVTHPIKSARHVGRGLARLFEPKVVVFTSFGGVDIEEYVRQRYGPRGWDIAIYPYFVWLSTAWFVIGVASLGIGVVRFPLQILKLPESIILIAGVTLSFAFVIGERGEEARFLISILPFLATYPYLVSVRQRSIGAGRFSGVTWLINSRADHESKTSLNAPEN